MFQERSVPAIVAGAVALLALWLGPAPVLAQTIVPAAPRQASSVSTEGAVVNVETEDLVVDLGASRGAAEGDEVEIWRPLRLRHPVTGKILTDRFLIGRLRLGQVRPTLALAKPEGKLSRAPELGDVVILVKGPLPPLPAGSMQPAAAATPGSKAMPNGEPADEDAKLLSAIFDSLRGADIPTRIRAYDAYVNAHPQARYVRVLWEEGRALRKLLVAAETKTVPEAPKAPSVTAEMSPLTRVVAREPLRIAVALRGDVAGAVLHVRTAGDPTYASQPMTKVGSEYWTASVPGERVQTPALDYFVEAVASDGTRPVVGGADRPETAVVEDVQPKPSRPVLGQAQIWTDYASFNAKQANDYVWQTEGVMGARLNDVGVRAVRTGFGVYRGVGGTLHELDDLGLAPRSVGLTYGYLEGEFGFTEYTSIGLRGIVGLREDGVGGGALAFFRIGSDLKTNLWFGGEVLGGIGLRGITQFEWNSFPRWPIVLRTEVTNEPAGVAVAQTSPGGTASEAGEVGARAIAQVGYRVLPHLVVSLRGSYQGRTINHAGPGAGAAVAYAW